MAVEKIPLYKIKALQMQTSLKLIRASENLKKILHFTP